MNISSDAKKKFDIIHVLSRTKKPTLQFISKETGIPESTLKRQIANLRNEYGMSISFVRDDDAEGKGRLGFYILHDWGIIDRTEFMQHYLKIDGYIR